MVFPHLQVHQENFGQINLLLITSFAADCNVACSLHTILAIHRQMWKVVDHVISERKQSHLLATALRAAGCNNMAFQVRVVNVNSFSVTEILVDKVFALI